MFSAYLDASGDETNMDVQYVSVSGFVAHATIWSEWEKSWLECLMQKEIVNEKGLPEFHMSACANYRFFFEGWRVREEERQDLLKKLASIIKGHLGFRSSCVINISDYKECIEPELLNAYGLSGAYVIGGRSCAARIKKWCNDCGIPLSRMQFFFEHGDHPVFQEDLLNRLLEDEYPRPLFKRKRNKYSPKTGALVEERLVPFQAADVIAYLTNINAKFSNRPNWEEKEKIRWLFDDLTHIAEPTFHFDKDYLRGFNTLMRTCLHGML